MSMRRLRATLLLVVVVALAIVAGCSGGAQRTDLAGGPSGTRAATLEPVATQRVTPPPAARVTAPPGLVGGGIVDVSELPPEAIDTLLLIEVGGPFPYSQDGATFQNREGLLPQRPRGTYAEYTVETPGSADRGARRIVTGDGRERYYTDDHYDSFRFIVSEP